jgi:hypothetical protein
LSRKERSVQFMASKPANHSWAGLVAAGTTILGVLSIEVAWRKKGNEGAITSRPSYPASPRPGARPGRLPSRLASGLTACLLIGACAATSGCIGGSGDSGGPCSATIGVNRLAIPPSGRIVEFLPDGEVRGIASIALRQFPTSSTAGLPRRPSRKVQAAVAKLQATLKSELALTPASAIQEVWRGDGRAVIARLMPGSYYVTLAGQEVRKTEIAGTGCWNYGDPQFDGRGRAVARAVLAPGD